jgi:hypothetical protein
MFLMRIKEYADLNFLPHCGHVATNSNTFFKQLPGSNPFINGTDIYEKKKRITYKKKIEYEYAGKFFLRTFCRLWAGNVQLQ